LVRIPRVPEPTLAEIRRALRNAPDLRPGHVFAGMPFVFRPERAAGVDATFFFDLAGDDGGTWTVRVQDGRCETSNEKPARWDVLIGCDVSTFLDLTTGMVRAGEAFVDGKLRVVGDLALAMRFSRFFGSSAA
jgi:putative sterol carrier protein